MQEEIATVVSVSNGEVELTTKVKNTCDGCEQNSQCGTGLLARYLAPKPENLTLTCALPLKPGQKVKIGIPESMMLKLSALIYLVPILLLVFSALLFGAVFTGQELLIIPLSFGVCVVYFFLVNAGLSNGFFRLGEPQIIHTFEEQETPIKMVK